MGAVLPCALRGVVFDLDGTLVDSSPDIAAALNTVLRANGVEPLQIEQVKSLVGFGGYQLVERALALRDVQVEHDVYAAFRAAYRARITRETRPYAGVVHLLTGLRRAGIAVGVCTNKPEEPAIALVAGLGLGVLIDALVGGDTLPTKKPDAAPIVEVLARMGVSADQAVLVGDSAADVGAGQAAGLATIGVAWGFGDIAGATHAVNDVAALTRLLDACQA